MTFPPEVWDGVLRRLKTELAPVSFDRWMPQIATRLSGDCLELHCPTRFHADRVRDFFLPQIGGCLQEEFGRPLALRVAVANDQKDREPTPRPDPPAAASPARPKVRPAKPLTRIIKSRSHDTLPIAVALSSAMPDALTEARIAGFDETATADHSTATNVTAGASAATRQPTTSAPRRQPTTSAPRRQPTFPLTFESFAVGPCNALAREVSMALATAPAGEHKLGLNQLFIVSGAGLGKTHLARAAATESARAIAERARYTTAETFTSEFTHAVRSDKMSAFKRRYRTNCDLLVVDDIQFLEGKAATQLEFFHTLHHVLDRGGRVLLTSDRFPQELKNLDARVRDRIASGFVAEVEAPDRDVRRSILRTKAAHGGIRLPDDCLDLLVDRIESNVRELEGTLIQLITVSSLFKRPIDLELTREALQDRCRKVKQQVAEVATPTDIIKTVAGFFKTSPEALASRSRRRDVLMPRQLSMYLCRRYTDASLADIGRALNRDHPSVKNAIEKVERQLLENAPMRYRVEALIARLDENGHRPLHAAC